MDFKTLNELATWMLSNIRLSRYDDQFVNNLTLYITQHNRITSNQDLLFRKVAGKYKKQFSQLKIEVEEVLTRPWDVKVVESIAEYTGASIKIENDKLILRSPFNKNFLTALKKNPVYSLEWIKDRRQYEGEYSHTNLKELMYLTADHYSILNYCDTVKQIIDSLSVYENVKYWVPTLVYKGHFYIAALNEHLYEAIKDIEKRKKALEELKSSPYIDPDDYVFFPSYLNRTTMMSTWGRLFREVVAQSKLQEKTGKNIQLYSLRHTSIMFRLIYSQVDTLVLAKNARTSQAVIEQFYGSHLTTAQARKQLHSFIDKKPKAIGKETPQ